MRSIKIAFLIILCLGLAWVYFQKVLLKNTWYTMLSIKDTTTEKSVSTARTAHISGSIDYNIHSFRCLNFQKYVHTGKNIGMEIPKGMEDARAPSTFYPLEPDKPGHFLIISGPPCSGKSTAALLMAQKYNFKYYEGDSFVYNGPRNPYLPLNSTNLNHPPKQRRLKLSKMDETIMKGGPSCDLFKNWDGKKITECVERKAKKYQVLAKHILQERQRLGGNFVVAMGIETRYFRDIIRQIIGPEMVYVILNISKELQYKRVIEREKNPKSSRFKGLVRVYSFFEGVQEGENRVIGINVDENKTIEMVVKEILSEI